MYGFLCVVFSGGVVFWVCLFVVVFVFCLFVLFFVQRFEHCLMVHRPETLRDDFKFYGPLI